MGTGLEALIGMAALAVAALGTFALYRWQQRRRVRRVEGWVRDYLHERYGKLPGGLRVDCSDDRLWPVLVDFDDPTNGGRCRLRFSCSGPRSAISLLGEEPPADGVPVV
jgi:hypothetical protein